jgi:hypothetical protein
MYPEELRYAAVCLEGDRVGSFVNELLEIANKTAPKASLNF